MATTKQSEVRQRALLLDRYLRSMLAGAERARATSRQMLNLCELPHHRRQVQYWEDAVSVIKWLQAHAPAYCRRYDPDEQEAKTPG